MLECLCKWPVGSWSGEVKRGKMELSERRAMKAGSFFFCGEILFVLWRFGWGSCGALDSTELLCFIKERIWRRRLKTEWKGV